MYRHVSNDFYQLILKIHFINLVNQLFYSEINSFNFQHLFKIQILTFCQVYLLSLVVRIF